MSDAWKSYPGAPTAGTALCGVEDLSDGDALSLESDGYPILLIRRGVNLHAYVNACPHQFLPLDHRGNQLLSEDGSVIRCTNHGAGFSVETGEGTEGLGLGECLDRIPVKVDREVVVVAG